MKKKNIAPVDIKIPFIVGLPRSGTTLLSTMLGSHHSLAITPKTNFFGPVNNVNHKTLTSQMFFDRLLDRQKAPYLEEWGLETEKVIERLKENRSTSLAFSIKTLYEIFARRWNKPFYGDGTASNLQHMAAISSYFPHSAFIHIIRDGRAQWLSEKKAGWGYPSHSINGACRWASLLQEARATAKSLPAYIEIQYEDLLSRPRKTLELILDFIGLEWDDQVLHYQENAAILLENRRNSTTPNGRLRKQLHHLLDQPLDLSRIDAWKKEVSSIDIFLFNCFAWDQLQEHNYLKKNLLLSHTSKILRGGRCFKNNLFRF